MRSLRHASACYAVIVLTATVVAVPTFHIGVDNRLYTGDIAGGPITTVQPTLGGSPFGGSITALGFNSLGQLYAATYAGQGLLYDLDPASGALTRPVGLGDNVSTFDTFDAGAGERMYLLRHTQLLVSNDNTPDSFSLIGTTGPREYGGSGWDGANFLAVSGGGISRTMHTINPFTGVASAAILTIDFSASSVASDNVHLGAGDWHAGVFYSSLFSDTDQTIVIGSIDLTSGRFTDRVVIPWTGSSPVGMGMAIIPEPGTFALFLAGAAFALRRRR